MNLSEVRWLSFQDVQDERGRLTAVEGENHIPFRIARVFYVHQAKQERGGHAHKDTDQVAVVANGRMKVDLSDGIETRTFHLADPGRGLYIPRLIFTRLYDFEPQTVLLVFASTPYDRSRSLRTWEDYLAFRHSLRASGGATGSHSVVNQSHPVPPR